MKTRRTVLHIALMLLLLGSQQMGMSHAFTHLLALPASAPGHAAPQDASAAPHAHSLPDELQCVQCLAFASIGSGLVDGVPPRFVDPQAGPSSLKAAAAPAVPPLIRAFDSRAPPVSC